MLQKAAIDLLPHRCLNDGNIAIVAGNIGATLRQRTVLLAAIREGSFKNVLLHDFKLIIFLAVLTEAR